jgi:hypothetical protein
MADDSQNSQQSPQDQTKIIEDLKKEVDQTLDATKNQMHQNPAIGQNFAATPPLQDTVVDIEKTLIDEIFKRIDQEKITVEHAQKLTDEFLALLPVEDQKELLEKLRTLSQTNSDAQGVFLDYIKSSEAQETSTKLDSMSKHLHQGNIEQALAIVKGGPHAG